MTDDIWSSHVYRVGLLPAGNEQVKSHLEATRLMRCVHASSNVTSHQV